MSKLAKKQFSEVGEIMKGVANHRRVQILDYLETVPDASIQTIADSLRVNFRVISQHVNRLLRSGLVTKRYDGRMVRNKPTARGKHILTFARMLE